MDVNWRHRHQQTKTKKILMQRFSSFVAPLSLQRSKLCHDEILLKSLIRLPLTYQSGKYSASGAQMPMVALFAVTWRFSFCKHLQFWREPGAFLESNLRASVRRWTSYHGDRRILIPRISSRHWNGPNSKDKKKNKKSRKKRLGKKEKEHDTWRCLYVIRTAAPIFWRNALYPADDLGDDRGHWEQQSSSVFDLASSSCSDACMRWRQTKESKSIDVASIRFEWNKHWYREVEPASM